MPEAAVDEERDFESGPREIGFASYGPVLSVPAQASLAQSVLHCLFGRAIPLALDGSHNARANLFRNVVHGGPLSYYLSP